MSMDPNKNKVSDKQHECSLKKSLNHSIHDDIIDLTTDCNDENDILHVNGNKHGNNTIYNKHLMTNSTSNDNNYNILSDKSGNSYYVDSTDVEIDNLPKTKPVFETICLCDDDDDDDDENDANDLIATHDNKDNDDGLSRQFLMISQQRQQEQQQQHRLQYDEQVLTENVRQNTSDRKRLSNNQQQLQEQDQQKINFQYVAQEDNHTVSIVFSLQESTKRFKSYNAQNDVDSDDVIIIDDDEMTTNDRSTFGTETSIYDYRNNDINTKNTSKNHVEENLVEFKNNNSISINPNDPAISNDTAVLVFIDDTASNDDCILTAGIMELLNNKNYSNANSISSKKNQQDPQQRQQLKTGKRKQQPQQQQRTIYTCHNPTLQHIQQRESWSCGYRNTQMLLSALVPLLLQDHTYYKYNKNNYIAGICTIPSRTQIQQTIEEYWTMGYDTTGAQHYNNTIINTTSKIGAMEVATYFQYVSIDCTVVQFMKCIQSRQLIGPFCYNYFYYSTTTGTSNSVSYHPNSQTIATNTLKLCTIPATNTTASISTQQQQQQQQQQPIYQKQIPLYLQWEGHSVTIIGIELRNDNTVKYLLVFDPAKNGSTIHNNLCNRRDTNDVSILRLPCNIVEKKDCQLIVCSTQSVSTAVLSNAKKSVSVITAAERDVTQSIASTTTTQVFPNQHGYY